MHSRPHSNRVTRSAPRHACRFLPPCAAACRGPRPPWISSLRSPRRWPLEPRSSRRLLASRASPHAAATCGGAFQSASGCNGAATVMSTHSISMDTALGCTIPVTHLRRWLLETCGSAQNPTVRQLAGPRAALWPLSPICIAFTPRQLSQAPPPGCLDTQAVLAY